MDQTLVRAARAHLECRSEGGAPITVSHRLEHRLSGGDGGTRVLTLLESPCSPELSLGIDGVLELCGGNQPRKHWLRIWQQTEESEKLGVYCQMVGIIKNMALDLSRDKR